MWEDEWSYNDTITSDHSKHHDVHRGFEYEFILRFTSQTLWNLLMVASGMNASVKHAVSKFLEERIVSAY